MNISIQYALTLLGYIALFSLSFVFSMESVAPMIPLLCIIPLQRLVWPSHNNFLLFIVAQLFFTLSILILFSQDPVLFFVHKAGIAPFLILYFLSARKDKPETIAKKNMQEKQFLDSITEQQNIAGGLAHEFNNYLMAIYGNIELLKYSPTEKHSIYHKRIDDAFALSKTYTSRMLFYSGRAKINPVFKISLQIFLENVIANNPILDYWSVKIEKEVELLIDQEQLQQALNFILEKCSSELEATIQIDDYKDTDKISWIFGRPKSGIAIRIPLPPDHKQTVEEMFTPYDKNNLGSFRLGLPYAGEIIRQHFATIGQDKEYLYLVFPNPNLSPGKS